MKQKTPRTKLGSNEFNQWPTRKAVNALLDRVKVEQNGEKMDFDHVGKNNYKYVKVEVNNLVRRWKNTCFCLNAKSHL